ncbi:uncharacterized protein LACBIDRAFT_324504 [Laccaria bicolor S238N-H82]|uniref:Predicted protein n=1 Tax=Laccaria bicolor (strain S238N-H82 / ATCC MYA-4686) TaxID=486041 RepID=B0D212_LACBS|nr:uncharacterized protein LACBIDRAFT_324504 [Laccaria bicolor S238N-H82]EDR12085.1 predicted protein [Laccaria bicolor S238N-H82]|eukprot:XP_001877982.1 predicted protein [Laccaria bicolor S238N-H82]
MSLPCTQCTSNKEVLERTIDALNVAYSMFFFFSKAMREYSEAFIENQLLLATTEALESALEDQGLSEVGQSSVTTLTGASGPDQGPAIEEDSPVAKPQSEYHPFVAAEDRWYAVLVGRVPGVYRGSHHIGPNVNGISGFVVNRYKSEQEAQSAYDAGLDAGHVVEVIMVETRRVITRSTP